MIRFDRQSEMGITSVSGGQEGESKSRGGKCEAVPTREVMCAPLVEDVVNEVDGGGRRGGGRKWG